jgi:glucosamine-6-phosphate deaminase
MEVIISASPSEAGKKAAHKGAELINTAIKKKGSANIIMATGVSQFDMLACLIKEKIDWNKVTAFHLDEYIGLPASHPASFRKYLKDRFADQVELKKFNYINGDEDPEDECLRLKQIIEKLSIDVAFTGIGVNGHLAFNDPPADFETEEPYIIVNLDEVCRRQQLGEGWFATLNDVPSTAISMSIKQIMKAETIICIAPEKRKAEAVKNTLGAEISPMFPASILRQHPDVWFYLDKESSVLLPKAL